MSLLRLAAPGKPTRLVDQGPAIGRRQPYVEMAKTVDDLPKGLWRNLPEKRR